MSSTANMIKLDFLPGHEQIKIYQDYDMFNINTDTYVLGEFLEVYKKDTVLEIGTNTGALLLYASRFHPQQMIGIDINEKALELAKKNMELNHIENCELKKADILTYSDKPVDVIICNPPYFLTARENMAKNEFKNIAKHELTLTLDGLVKGIARNLKDNGKLYFVNISPRLDEVLLKLREYNIIPKEVKFVFDENKEFSNIFMVKAVKNAKPGMNVSKPVIISRK